MPALPLANILPANAADVVKAVHGRHNGRGRLCVKVHCPQATPAAKRRTLRSTRSLYLAAALCDASTPGLRGAFGAGLGDFHAFRDRGRCPGRCAVRRGRRPGGEADFHHRQQCRRLRRRPLPGFRRELRHGGGEFILPARANSRRRCRSARSTATTSPAPSRRAAPAPATARPATTSSPSSARASPFRS